MDHKNRKRTSGLIAALVSCALCAQASTLTIYWVDTEGGAATLITTPAGQSLLIDTGNPGERDANRIFEVATKQAQLKKLDYVLISHFHSDHVGGVPALAKLMPIEHFLDHGESVEQDARGKPLWDAYLAASEGKRQTLKPGNHISLKGLNIEVISSNGKLLDKPLKGGGPNSLCAGAEQKAPDKTENQRSLGILLTYGKFKFLDLGDLTWDKEMELACPVNKLGTVTLFQATHHGFYNDFSGAPAFIGAIQPEVVVVNNGPYKGWQESAWNRMTAVPNVEAIWQLHLSVRSDKQHNTKEDRIANVDTPPPPHRGGGNPASGAASSNAAHPEVLDGAHWLKASVQPDGEFSVTNSRNDYQETYKSR